MAKVKYIQLVLTHNVRAQDKVYAVLANQYHGTYVDEDGTAWEPIPISGNLGALSLRNGLPIKEYEVSFTSDGANPTFSALVSKLDDIKDLKLKVYLMEEIGLDRGKPRDSLFRKYLISTMRYSGKWSLTTQGKGVQVVAIGFQNLAKSLDRDNASYLNSADFPGDGYSWWDVRTRSYVEGFNSWIWVRE